MEKAALLGIDVNSLLRRAIDNEIILRKGKCSLCEGVCKKINMCDDCQGTINTGHKKGCQQRWVSL